MEQLGLPQDWLNNGAKGFISANHDVRVFRRLSHLTITAATPEYLFAMKCIASRLGFSRDLEDIQFLIRHLKISSLAEAYRIWERFYPPKYILPKTQYVLETLFHSKMKAVRVMSIKDVVRMSHQDKANYDLYVGDFLDEFYRSDQKAREAMVTEEPEASDRLEPHLLPFLAGAVHKLCNDYHVSCPSWVRKSKYRLNEPYFPLNAQGALRQLLIEESPAEFKERNLFPSANCLSRA